MGVGMRAARGSTGLSWTISHWALGLSLPICKMGLGWFIPEAPLRPDSP